MRLFVQFEDAKAQKIISLLSAPSDPEEWPNQGEIEISDPLYQEYWSGLSQMVQIMLQAPD